MLTTTCTVCREPMPGHPDDDVTCMWCESENFRGDLLRYPPQTAQPLDGVQGRPWWIAARGPLAPRSRTLLGAWSWTEDNGTWETQP